MRFIHILFFAVFLSACSTDSSKRVKANESATAAAEISNSDAPVMTFDKLSHDFGIINEGEVVETVLPDMMEDEPTAFVTYEKFEKKMLEVMAQNLYEPDTDDVMLAAFRAIDTDKKGYIDADRMRELLSTYGTAFRPKEIDGFMSRAKDMETGRIYFEDYIALFQQEVEEMENE